MSRPEKAARAIEYSSTKSLKLAWWLSLGGILFSSILGCQVVGGLEELKLANDAAGGAGGSGGNGTSSTGNSSSSVASSSGAPIMGDVACGGVTCPIGTESACCYDHYKTNSDPYLECVNGPAGNDGCNTAGGANGYETRIECQLPAHCAIGTVCCGNIETISIVTWYTTLSCTTTCTWPDTVVCDPMNPNNVCPVVNDNGTMVQTACAASDILPPGYGVCK
jgi:hypothetical protein